MLKPNPDYIRELCELINHSPFPQHLPMQITAISLGRATVVMTASQNHLQPLKTVHGGVLATLIDTATYWAAFLALPQDHGLVNVDLKLNYLRPAHPGVLTANGRCIKPGRSISYAEASVIDGEGKLIAHGTSTLLAIPDQGLELQNEKFVKP